MNFNALEFTHHNSYYPSLSEENLSEASQISTTTATSLTSEQSSNAAETGFFSSNNFLKNLASGILFTGRSSIYSSPMDQKQQQNSASEAFGNRLMRNASKTFINSSSVLAAPTTSTLIGSNNIVLPNDYLKNSVVLNASAFSEEAWQRQIEYDKFMNEIWIGIVLTLIIISMVFCICSCFLYHQFRLWKMNYRRSVQQSQDIESVKLNLEDDDPVPQYTLVSGLPTYEAALDMLKKYPHTPIDCDKSTIQYNCVATTTKTYPSVFSIFTKNEKSSSDTVASNYAMKPMMPKIPSSIDLKSLVRTTASNDSTTTTSNSTSSTTTQHSNSAQHSHANFNLLAQHVMHKNAAEQQSTTATTATATTTTTMIDRTPASEASYYENAESSADEDDENCEKSQNQEAMPLKSDVKN